MMWPQNDPSAEAVAEIDHNSAEGESNGIRKGSLQGEDEDLEPQKRQEKQTHHCLTLITKQTELVRS